VRLIVAERQLTVTWKLASGAESYEVYYGSAVDTSNGESRTAATRENIAYYGSSAAVISSLSNGVEYYVWVKAANSNGETWSEAVSGTPQIPTTPPETPKNVRATGLDGQLLVTWDAADGATSYEVYLGSDSTPAVTSGLRWVFGNLENGAEHTVQVKANNIRGSSSLSAPVTGTPAAAPVFDDLAEFAAYLRELPQNTAATPHAAALSGFNLSNGDLSSSNDPLGMVYAIMGTKYLSLDLSGCTGNLGTLRGYADKSRLVSCVLPEDLTSIAASVFSGCTSLASIELPDSLTSIGDQAFQNCTSLVSIKLPEGLLGINRSVFQGCTSLAFIELPDNLERIFNAAFSGCTALTSVELPDSLTAIDANAFFGCTSLASIELPDSLTSIDSNVFQNCTSLASIELPDSLERIFNETFSGCTSLTSVELPDSLTTIWHNVFSGCTSLASIELPDSLTTIWNNVFSGCTSLASVELPDSLTSIGSNVFQNCTALTSVKLPDSLTSIGTYTFSGCTALTSVELPGSLTTIGNSAFSGCTALEGPLGLPNTLTSIGSAPFSNTGVRSFTVAQGGTTPFSTAENGKILLKTEDQAVTVVAYPSASGSVSLPAETTAIGPSAFSGCIALTEVDMPAEITTIGNNAFVDSLFLSSVTIRAETPPMVGSGNFAYTGNLQFYVPAGKVDDYKAATWWSGYTDRISAIPAP
jgi:hypothetical protein